MINQAWEKPFPMITLHPRGDKAPTEHDSSMGELLLEEADHGKGREGLAQIVEGKACDCCIVTFDDLPQALAEIFIKGVFLGIAGSVEEIIALDRREARVVVVGKADAHPLAACNGEEAVYVQYRAFIGIDIRIGLPAFEAAQVLGEIAKGSACPRVSREGRFCEETEHPFEIGVKEGVLDIVSSQCSRKQGDTPRRLTWFGNRGKDQQDLFRAFRTLHLPSLE